MIAGFVVLKSESFTNKQITPLFKESVKACGDILLKHFTNDLNIDKPLKITGYKADTVVKFFDFVQKKAILLETNVSNLMAMAHFYNVTPLVDLLERQLAENMPISTQNIASLVGFANTYESSLITKVICVLFPFGQ